MRFLFKGVGDVLAGCVQQCVVKPGEEVVHLVGSAHLNGVPG